MLPGRFLAVVFDLDGLLIATEGAWAAAERELLARHGHRYTQADRLATIGRSVDDSIAVFGRRIGIPESTYPDLRVELLDRFREHARSATLQPGAGRLVEALDGRLPLAIASASPRAIVEELLSSAGLAAAFRVIVSGDDVSRPKPAPEAYLLACRRLGVTPATVVAFEDSEPGIRAAVAAGLHCVAVPSDPGVDTSGADLVLSTLEVVEVAA